MNLKSIVNQINNLITTARPPQSTFPMILIACSAINKPGLSAAQLTSQIISDLQKNGFNMGNLADGSQNGWATSVAVGVKDLIDHFKKYGKITSEIPIGQCRCENEAGVATNGDPIGSNGLIQ